MGLNYLIIEQRTKDVSLQQYLFRAFAIVAALACLASIHLSHILRMEKIT